MSHHGNPSYLAVKRMIWSWTVESAEPSVWPQQLLSGSSPAPISSPDSSTQEDRRQTSGGVCLWRGVVVGRQEHVCCDVWPDCRALERPCLLPQLLLLSPGIMQLQHIVTPKLCFRYPNHPVVLQYSDMYMNKMDLWLLCLLYTVRLSSPESFWYKQQQITESLRGITVQIQALCSFTLLSSELLSQQLVSVTEILCCVQGCVDDMIQDLVDCIQWIHDSIQDYGGDKVNT